MPRKHADTLAVIDMIAAERIRQVTAEGFDHDHDDAHADGVLARAGACYAMNAGMAAAYEARHGLRMLAADYARSPMPADWPWALDWWKPKTQLQDLVRAAALLVAEIERQIRQQGSLASGAPQLPPPPSDAEVKALIGGRAFAAPSGNLLFTEGVEAYTSDRRFAHTREARAIIEGAPTDLRARLAEACARAGFACRFLPERLYGSRHIWLTLAAPPGKDLNAAMDEVQSGQGFELVGRHPVKDHADPALCAGVATSPAVAAAFKQTEAV